MLMFTSTLPPTHTHTHTPHRTYPHAQGMTALDYTNLYHFQQLGDWLVAQGAESGSGASTALPTPR